MAASNSERRQVSFFQLNGKADKDTTPAFWRSEKQGDKWVKTESFDTVSGVLTKAELKQYTWESTPRTCFHIELTDSEGVCAIDMNHTQCAHGIVNSLATMTPGQEIKIRVYKKTNKDNGKIYAGGIVLDPEGKPLAWLHKPADQPKGVAVEVNGKPYMKDGKPVYDDANVRAFWEKVFTDHVAPKVVSNEPPKPEPTPPPADDLPF